MTRRRACWVGGCSLVISPGNPAVWEASLRVRGRQSKGWDGAAGKNSSLRLGGGEALAGQRSRPADGDGDRATSLWWGLAFKSPPRGPRSHGRVLVGEGHSLV